jgi:hypothetical protein
LWNVSYREDQQRKIISKAIDFAWQNYTQLPVDKRAQNAADAMQFFIPTFKNHDFEEENEWRLIFTPRPDLQVKPRFRTARNMLVPYYSLQDLGWSSTHHVAKTDERWYGEGRGTFDLQHASAVLNQYH